MVHRLAIISIMTARARAILAIVNSFTSSWKATNRLTDDRRGQVDCSGSHPAVGVNPTRCALRLCWARPLVCQPAELWHPVRVKRQARSAAVWLPAVLAHPIAEAAGQYPHQRYYFPAGQTPGVLAAETPVYVPGIMELPGPYVGVGKSSHSSQCQIE